MACSKSTAWCTNSSCPSTALPVMRESGCAVPRAELPGQRVSPAREPLAVQPAWAVLLDGFYTRAGLRPPLLRQLMGEDVPQPYHSLLVHSLDMTPTLEG